MNEKKDLEVSPFSGAAAASSQRLWSSSTYKNTQSEELHKILGIFRPGAVKGADVFTRKIARASNAPCCKVSGSL